MGFQRKDNSESLKYRNKGNDYFNQKKFYEASEFFNQSLCFAGKGSLNQSLAYANRSAVYMEIGEYEKCLKNIQLAKVHGYPADKIKKLNDRETNCLAKIADHRQSQQEFCLSHEPNQRMPFVSDCLKLREDDKYGRHIITEKELKVGDILAMEPAFVACPSAPEKYSRCYNCFKSNMMDLTPCQHCAEGTEIL